MSMFDSVFATVQCPLCKSEREYEVQFKLSVGQAFSPSMRELHIGDMVEGLPPIARVEAVGYVGFECCPDDESRRSEYALIVFERGRLVGVTHPLAEDHEWAPLPRGRSSARRDAASQESFERRRRELLRRRGIDPEKATGIERIGVAMAVPLMQFLDYAGIAKRLMGETRGSYWRPSPGEPWRRREECPL